jgi:hypothetical protein
MSNLSKACAIVAAVAFMAAAPSARAEDVARNKCQPIGQAAFQKLSDHPDHGFDIVTASCRVATGPIDGGVITAQYFWEWNKNVATLIYGGGVVRKGDSLLVYQYTEGTITLVMTDGKVTEIKTGGKGRWPIATGAAASLAGKTFTWASKASPTGEYETVWTAD